MKFTCNARELNTACNNVMRAVSTKMTVPTIEGILMECGSDTLSLTGYDFEFGINTTLQASVTEPGAIVINAKVLCNIIKELTAETVTFDISGTSVSIICGAAQYAITGIDADDYPELPSVSGGYPLFLNQNLLQKMVQQTLFAVADSEASKPVHTGLKFEMSLNQLRLIGVDGYRLAIRTETVKYDGEDISFIVPKKTVRELIKLLNPEEDENISVSVGKRHIVFIRQKFDNRGIEIARSRTHGNAAERSETHRRIDALSALDRGNGRTVAEVQRDDFEILIALSAEIFGRFLRNESVARSVESVSSDFEIGIRFVRNTVNIRLFGHGGMESRIENAYHRHAGHDSLTSANTDYVGRLMKGSKFGKFLDFLHYVIR